MPAGDGAHLHASSTKPAPTQLSISNPVERLSSYSKDSDTAAIVFWHEVGPGKVNTPRTLAFCRNFCWLIRGSRIPCLPCQETRLLFKYLTQKRAQSARVVFNVHEAIISVLQYPGIKYTHEHNLLAFPLQSPRHLVGNV